MDYILLIADLRRVVPLRNTFVYEELDPTSMLSFAGANGSSASKYNVMVPGKIAAVFELFNNDLRLTFHVDDCML